ncbi:MAG: heme-binding protein [Deltaproteobacteria bacterium]|jgi:hypothetical protein|nr:heme-binding protein [Deltaproteobacteria bacterium]MBT6489264.1 heme-binding protein [Deltaproteobacteria bacterium]
MLLWFIGIAVTLVVLWAGYTQFYEGGLGQPEYSVLSTGDDIEFRRYEPFIIASTQLSQSGNSGLSSGFRVLAGYIFGGNNPGEKLAMTAPVLQQNSPGESIPMTAPVLRSAEGMRMAFVMPAGRSLEDLPSPQNAKVSLTPVDWGEAVAIRFAGRGKQERFNEAEAKLRAALKQSGRTASGPALYAQYNSPSAFPPLRRNEVIIPIAPK